MTAAPSSVVRVDPAAVRRTLREANLRARRSLSQNFLTDPDVLESIIAAAAPEPGDRVLEIGPGLGILTDALLSAGVAVTAVEVDRGLASWLTERHPREMGLAEAGPDSAGSLRLIEGDILDEDVGALMRPPFLVVANLPYHITSPVLHRLLGLARPPERMVLMVQREVAERIAAPPGAMSYLSVFVQFHAHVEVVRMVPRDAFEPAPKVESAVIVVQPPGAGAAADLDLEQVDDLWRLVQTAFRERRKMLHNVLARQLPIDARAVEAALASAGIAGDRRPQTLSVGEWIRLLHTVGPLPPDRRGQRTDDA